MGEFNQEAVGRGAVPDRAMAAVMREAETWTRAQGELVCGIEAMWAAWVKRQLQAIDASAHSLQRMYECRSIADLVQIQQQFLAAAVERGMSDASTLASDAAAVMRRIAGTDADAAGAGGRREPVPEARREAPASGVDALPQRAAAE